MNVYVAGASRNWQRARRVIDALARVGVRCTQDWPAQVEIDRAHGRTDADLAPVQVAAIRAGCLAGVRAASTVLWLAEPSDGASVEVGYALARGIPVIVAGEGHPIYGAPGDEGPVALFRTDARAIEYLAQFARYGRCA